MTAEQETHQGVGKKVCNFIFRGLVERRRKKKLWGQSLCQKMLKKKINLTAKVSTNVHNHGDPTSWLPWQCQ